jgi:GTPase-activator protein for Ras-like GTPase
MPRYSDAKYTAVGAFIFLRFFCPAIVAPEVEGLVSTTPSKEMRRGLTLIAKIIQNLANNVLFGAKEPYMYPLNDFLTQNIYRVTTFLREISVCYSTVKCPAVRLTAHRSRRKNQKSPQGASPSTLALALLSTASYTTTGTTCAIAWSRRRGGTTSAPRRNRPVVVHPFSSP